MEQKLPILHLKDHPDVPFVFVSGRAGEERAIKSRNECIPRGLLRRASITEMRRYGLGDPLREKAL